MDGIEITDSILTNQLTFQGYSPSAEQMENGTTFIHTFSHMTYDLDPLDFNNHLSAKYKKKFVRNIHIFSSIQNPES